MPVQKLETDHLIHSLLSRLREEGFSIGTEIYLQTYQLLLWFVNTKNGTSLSEFGLYLAPVICKSDEEQAKFRRIFDSYFMVPIAEHIAALRAEKVELLKKTRRWVVGSLVALAVIAFSVIIVLKIINYHPKIYFPTFNILPGYANKNDLIQCSIAKMFENPGDTVYFQTEYIIHSNGEHQKGNNFYHRFDQYRWDSISIKLKSEKCGVDTTLVYHIYIGPEKRISIAPERELVLVGEQNTFLANIDTAFNPDFHWTVNSKPVGANVNPLIWTFEKPGVDTIRVSYDEPDSLLNSLNLSNLSNTYLQEISSSDLHLVSEYTEPPTTVNIKLKLIWLVALLLGILLLARETFKAMKWKKDPTTPHQQENFQGDRPPYELQFSTKDQNIVGSSALFRLSNELKKRTESQAYFFNIPRTIRESISNLGFFSPRFSRKQVQREYLLLIDQPYINSQQTKLFTYLAKYFVHRSVLLNFYYFYQSPDKFYKDIDGTRYSVSQLKDLHYNASLIFISDGVNFIRYNAPALKNEVITDFSYWPNRAMLTPVQVMDWGASERILSSFFNLLPADIIGLMEVARAIESDEYPKTATNTNRLYTYEAKYVDFNTVASLRNYLDGDEELFQWLCTTAIHPKIYWEVFLETGAKLLKNKSKINYETLLKLARIQWMAEGILPPHIRFMLLKELSVKNELQARAVFLQMLDEIVDTDDNFSFEEKQLSRYANSFMLAASGDKVYQDNTAIQEDSIRFIALYKNKALTDNPFLKYIQKNPADGTWKTPIVANDKNTGIDEFIEDYEGDAARKIKQNRWKHYKKLVSYGALTLGVLALLWFAFFWPAAFAKTMIDHYLHLIERPQVEPNNLSVNILPVQCKDKLVFDSDDSTLIVVLYADWIPIAQRRFRYSDSIVVPVDLDQVRKVAGGSDWKMVCTINDSKEAYSASLPVKPGTHYVKLEGNCTEANNVEAHYFPGFDEDTSYYPSVLRKSEFKVLTFTRSGKSDNHIIFDHGIDTSLMFTFCKILVNSGFNLKKITIKSPGADSLSNKLKIIEIRADNVADLVPISLDSLRCLFMHDCKEPTPPLVKMKIRIYHNEYRFTSKIREIRSCLHSPATVDFLDEQVDQEQNEDLLIFYNDRLINSVNTLINCLKKTYPGKTFRVENSIGASRLGADMEIYLNDKTPKATIDILISDESLIVGAESLAKTLIFNGFRVLDTKVSIRYDASKIEYYKPGLKDQGPLIRKLFSQIFPDINISYDYSAPGRNSNPNPEILIWVNKNFRNLTLPVNACDTLYGFIDEQEKESSFIYNGHKYSNGALFEKGIQIGLINFDGKVLDLELRKDKCNFEKYQTLVGNPTAITFCDSTRLVMNVEQSLNSTSFKEKWLTKLDNKDVIIYKATFCKKETADK